MTGVTVVVLHAEAGPGAGPLSRVTADARRDLADRHVRGFLAVGATRASVIAGPPDVIPFGARLRVLAEDVGDGGLVVLGSGAIPLASASDRRRFVAAAASAEPGVLTNNRYSADIIAIACATSVLRDRSLEALATDNALPRWLEEHAGVAVRDLRAAWRLGVDIDGPLDLVLLGGRWARRLAETDVAPVRAALGAVRAVAHDPSRELIVAGRLAARGLAWLETKTASRTRALIEERGLRTRTAGQRAAASVLGVLLDRDGPQALGRHLARLGDAAIIDSRVLLAHRFGADEAVWPAAEDRFASDLLLPDRIADPWLRALTTAAVEAPIPIVLGGHTLVGPALRFALDPGRSSLGPGPA